MKRITCALMSLILCLCAVCAFGEAVPESAAYQAGTYTSTQTGINPLTVEVVFSDSYIEEVNVIENNETDGIGSNAIASLPGKIVEKQTLNLDVVSGATLTSTAILAAVSDCVEQAGGDIEALMVESEEETVLKKVETIDTQLVIVGGGAAGMTACIRATELGLKVVLLEKMSFMGGAVSVSGGNQVVMGSELQANCGVTDDSVDSMVEDFMKNGAGLNVPELINLYAENVGATSDWLQEKGVTFNTEAGLHQLAEYSHNRELAYTGGGAGAAENMRNAIAATDATVMLNTRATELLTNMDGAVVGVIAESEDTVYTVNADAVLLATGGYGNNKDLQTEEIRGALYYGPVSSTGDGIIMATAENVNAATRLMEFGKRYPNGIEVSEGIAKSTIAGNLKVWPMSAILVNAEGNRVVNEKASNRTILEVELEQTGSELFLVLDQANFDVWSEALGYDISAYVEANGSSTPVIGHGDTIEEAAANAGVDGTALAETVARYNTFVQNGNDEDFGRNPDYMTMEIGDGPYYLIEQKPRFATTMGGLVANTELQVINNDGNVIAGLFAAGETVGGVMGDDSPSGANNGWAVTAGKLAAESIAAKLLG